VAYLTKAELVEKVGEDTLLTLADKNSTGDLDDAEVDNCIEQAIAFATSKINGYVRHRYDIPLAASEEVKSLAMPLALYDLYANALEMPDGKYKIVKDGFDAAIKFLQDVAGGKATLEQSMLSTTITGVTADVPLLVVQDEADDCGPTYFPPWGCERFR
jgi:phage gp36-like protein